jgi:hypothetical protein
MVAELVGVADMFVPVIDVVDMIALVSVIIAEKFDGEALLVLLIIVHDGSISPFASSLSTPILSPLAQKELVHPATI